MGCLVVTKAFAEAHPNAVKSFLAEYNGSSIPTLTSPDSGSIKGIARHRIGVVFQEDRLLPWLTASENLNMIFKN